MDKHKVGRHVVGVKFPNNYAQKEYDFWADILLRKGDTVVVDTVNGLTIATVSTVDKCSNKATKWVVQKVIDTRQERRNRQLAQVRELEEEISDYINENGRCGNLALINPLIADRLDRLKNLKEGLL